MLNRKNILFQAIENGFEETIEGYPIETKYSKEKDAIDYTVYGNTVYSENLFNYTEPYNDDQIKADEDGWFDITIDNTYGTGYKYVTFFTKPNLQLKTDTSYYVKLEMETKTGDINCYWVSNNTNDLSQFTASLVDGSGYVITRSYFTNCKYMMRGNIRCNAGGTGHAKFRIAVYETQKDEFLPYSKQSVGDKTENLFNYTEPYYNYTGISDDGWWDVTIDNTEGTKLKTGYRFTKASNKLKPNTDYYVYLEIAERSGDIGFGVSYPSTSVNMVQFITKLGDKSGIVTTRDDFSNCVYMLRTSFNCAAGKSGHIKYRIAVYEAQKDTFEPYDKYKIPITVTGKNLFDKSISIRDDIRNETTITSSDYTVPILKNNVICKILKPDTTYTISCEFECTAIPSDSTYRHGVLGFIASTGVEGYSIISATINKQMLVGERYKFSKTFTTPSNFGTEGKYGFVIYRNAYYKGDSTVAASMICRKLQIEEGTSATSYEPYHEPVTTNIYRDAQLGQGESINYKADNLPTIKLANDTNKLTIDTEVEPSKMLLTYTTKVRESNE